MSRAACNASVASVACSEPTCLCASPLRLRMKTSQSGMFGVAIMFSLFCGLRDRARFTLLGKSQRRFAYPGAVIMRLAPRRETIAVAGAVAGQHPIDLFPIDRAVFSIVVSLPL